MKKIFIIVLIFDFLKGSDVLPFLDPILDQIFKPTDKDLKIYSKLEVRGQVRRRYEFVNTDNSLRNAHGFTNRLTFSMKANLDGIENLYNYLEATNVSGLGPYWNSSMRDVEDKDKFNAISDPDQTRISQAYVEYSFNNTDFYFGRKVLKGVEERFLGKENWRQMFQSFDLALIETKYKDFSFMGAYVWKVHQVFDADSIYMTLNSTRGDQFDTSSLFFEFLWKKKFLSISLYSYLIEDFHNTYGVYINGNFDLSSKYQLFYKISLAQQKDPSFNYVRNNKVNSSYFKTSLKIKRDNFAIEGFYENLEEGLSTLLGSFHLHNGWADRFKSLPKEGLKDIGVKAFYSKNIEFQYHSFFNENIHYGKEFDGLYRGKIPNVKDLVGELKVAYYKANNWKVNTTKVWFTLDYNFSL